MGAFAGSGLPRVSLPQVGGVGAGAFRGCPRLQSAAVGAMAESLFESCGLLSEVEFGPSVASIGRRAFAGSGLVSVSLHAGILSLEVGCFAGCGGLEEVNISGPDPFVGESAFADCPSLAVIVLCGRASSGDSCGLGGKDLWIFVTAESGVTEFCGLQTEARLGADCLFLPPTATPSSLFTWLTPERPNAMSLVFGVLEEGEAEGG